MEKHRQKSPSRIELLNEMQCEELEIDGVCVKYKPSYLLSINQEYNEIVIRKFTDNRISYLKFQDLYVHDVCVHLCR